MHQALAQGRNECRVPLVYIVYRPLPVRCDILLPKSVKNLNGLQYPTKQLL